MKTLPNGVRVFNATPHPITFWREDWPNVVTVESDMVVNAVPKEELAKVQGSITFVKTVFKPTAEGLEVLSGTNHVDVVVGSIIAAQAYPGKVCAMIPCAGYERVPPAEKRMRPDKFTIF